MEEFGDWIYVIILVIAGISSIISSFRKNAKQKAEEAQAQTQPQPQQREVIHGDIFDDDYWGTGTPNEEPKIVIPAPVSRPQYKTIDQQLHLFNQHQEGSTSFKLGKEESILLEEEDVYTSVTLEDLPKDSDEWRKAFVYNEIINRKY